MPASALLEDIKLLTNVQSQVLAVLSKDIEDLVYKDIRHVAKGLNLQKVVMPEDTVKKISLEKYVPKKE